MDQYGTLHVTMAFFINEDLKTLIGQCDFKFNRVLAFDS